jgi:PKD repeat protein
MFTRLISSSIILLALAGCQLDEPQAPVASFSADSSGCAAPCRITFKNLSQNTSVYAWTYEWRFSDSLKTFSVDREPVYMFTKPGTYQVIMSISNPVYGTDTTSQTVNIIK